MAAEPAAQSGSRSDGAGARQSKESLARTYAGSERRRVGVYLLTAWPTGCGLFMRISIALTFGGFQE